jgi:hypothetical protein
MRSTCSVVPGNFLMFQITFFSTLLNSALCPSSQPKHLFSRDVHL